MPSEIKLETPIEQSDSKLMQDVTLVSDVPTPFHAEHDISLPNGTTDQPMTGQQISLPDRAIDQHMTEQEISVSNKTTLGRLIPKIHTRQRKILGSKLVRTVIPINTFLISRPPPKSTDRQNCLNDKISRRVLPYINPKKKTTSQAS